MAAHSQKTESTPATTGGVTDGVPVTPDLPDFSDIILEVRMGKMKSMPGLKILSGIDKEVMEGPVHVNELGIEGDEHDLTFHGGVDKALHGYCSSHYPLWRSSHPSSAPLFRPGAFGENLVLAHMSETNICIADIYSVAFPTTHSTSSLLLQISLPRQPCFKLNHRFRLKNFAPETYKLSRTGWYYRVLREGILEMGMEMRLVGRENPGWTVGRVQEFLHREMGDVGVNEVLSKLGGLGGESRGVFVARVAKQKVKERRVALGEEERKKWRGYRIVEKKRETETGRVVSFVLEAERKVIEGDGEEVELDEGAHVKLRLPVGNGLVRAYSIAGGEDKNRFVLGVAYDAAEDKSRGGSKYLHVEAKVGDVIQVGGITAGVPIVSAASNHVFVVGGIGITAFLMLMETYKRINYSFELHYAVRSGEEVPFRERVLGLGEGSGSLFVSDESKGERMDIERIVDGMPWNSQLYFCGPKRMMDEAGRVVRGSKRGIGEKEVHFEAFEADVGGDAFEAVVGNREGTVVRVGEETLLEKLQERFGEGEVASSCCVGNCGTCVVKLKSGRVNHRGTALTGEETRTEMLACVSRGVGRIVIEI